MTASCCAAAARAAASSPPRQAAATSPAQPGCPVIELEARNTTPAPPAAAIGSRRPSTSATAPKKFTDTTRAGSVPVNPPMPAAGTTPCTTSVAARTPHGRRPALGGREVRGDVGIAQVDGDHPVALLAEQHGGGRPDARGGAADDVGARASGHARHPRGGSATRTLGGGGGADPRRPTRGRPHRRGWRSPRSRPSW